MACCCCWRRKARSSSARQETEEHTAQKALEQAEEPSPDASPSPNLASTSTSTTTTAAPSSTSVITSTALPISSITSTSPSIATPKTTYQPHIPSASTSTYRSPSNSTSTYPSRSPSPSSSSRSSISSSSSSSSTPDRVPTPPPAEQADQPADDATRELQQALRFVLLRRIVQLRMLRSRRMPSPLGEDLCRAAHRGQLGDVQLLLDFGADVNYISFRGYPPLNAVFYFPFEWRAGNPDVVLLLLRRGADVSAIDVGESSALHRAAYYDSSGVCVALLITAGADVDARDGRGATPLHWAAINGNEAAVRALLAAGARKNVKCWGGWSQDKTPLEVARAESVRELLRA